MLGWALGKYASDHIIPLSLCRELGIKEVEVQPLLPEINRSLGSTLDKYTVNKVRSFKDMGALDGAFDSLVEAIKRTHLAKKKAPPAQRFFPRTPDDARRISDMLLWLTDPDKD